MNGKNILHYKILKKIGEGGMGVVYKAEDTKLKRDVALKFLPTNALQSSEEKDRFLREAQAAASFTHTNIALIYTIEEFEDQVFIAMEFIEGQSLSEIVTSPLPLNEAINYATQIASGLQAAQEKNITHRDIKSANIMVNKKGEVKIMDFGLAKLANRTKMTMEGSTLGTASYMSPEQARGEQVDHRSDIWSLGVVLYEMISGQLPFKGDYEQAVIYSILNEEPEPLTALRSGLSIALDGIIAKALAKDPAIRYQHVDELPADLKAIDSQSASLSRISTIKKPPESSKGTSDSLGSRSSLLPWSLVGVAFVLVLVLSFIHFSEEVPEAPVTRFVIPLPENHLVEYGRDWVQQAFSPDGRKIVYVVQTFSGSTQLYLRDLDNIESIPIYGTDGAYNPFFSPDGQWIGFTGNGKLWKISVFGGKRLLICDSAGGLPAAWGDGIIIFTPRYNIGLWQVSDQGGEPKMLTQPDESKQEAGHRFPQLLPDGETVLFTSKPPSSDFDEATIATVSLKTGVIKKIFTGGSYARYLPTGHLVYMLGERLMAVPFDPDKLEIIGTPIMLLESLTYDVNFGSPQLAFSSMGALVYLPQIRGPENVRLAWLDRSGEASLISKDLGRVEWASISPNDKRVALAIREEASSNIVLLELERQILTYLTTNPDHDDSYPFWSPNGEYVGFWSSRPADQSLFQKRSDGSGETERLVIGFSTERELGSWTPDGRTLVYVQTSPETLADLWILHINDHQSEVFVNTNAVDRGADFSPTGRWIAYASNESGREEVYIRPFPTKDPKVIVSNEGGQSPFWSRDGRELFYLNGRQLMVVSIPQRLGQSVKPGIPRELFELPKGHQLGRGMSEDGQNFLALQSDVDPDQNSQHLVVVLNWFEEVKQKMGQND